MCPIQSFRSPKWIPICRIHCFLYCRFGRLVSIFSISLFCLLFVLLRYVKLGTLSIPSGEPVCVRSECVLGLIKLRITRLTAYTWGIWTIDLIKLELELINREIRTGINFLWKKNHTNWWTEFQIDGPQISVQVCTFKIWPLFIVQPSEN